LLCDAGMHLHTLLAPALAVPVMSLAACVIDDAADLDTSADVATLDRSSIVDHGELPRSIDARTEAALSARDRVHLWTFTVDGPAEVAIRTGRAGRAAVDTVLALPRETAHGWRAVARDDDGGDGLYSALERGLDAGHYRVRVSGFLPHERGRFALTVACSGAGCGVAPPACVFGDTFRAIDRDRFAFGERVVLTAASPLDAITAVQVVRAVHASSHTDVTTPAEAFARVDQNEINRIPLLDGATGQLYIAYEYGAGDNSYGAIFADGAPTRVVEIHDGELVECTVTD
jgi:hypothetical protein